MGYTHYFETNNYSIVEEDTRIAIAKDVKKVFSYVRKNKLKIDGEPLFINGCSLGINPIANKTMIVFNGGDEKPTKEEFENRKQNMPKLSHETFYIEYDSGKKYDFCKTARKPYDAVVCCVLIVLKEHLGYKFNFSSDGDFNNDEWERGIELYNTVFNQYLHTKESIGGEYVIVK